MSTIQDLIVDALTDLGVIAPAETPTSDELAYGLRKANQLVDSWSAQGLPLYQITCESVILSGMSTYTLPIRPLKIKAANFVNAGGLLTPLAIVTAEEFARGDRLKVLYCDGGYPSSNIQIRPSAVGSLDLYSYRPLTQFATLLTAVSFPPGYERAIRASLVLELALGFGKSITQPMVDMAAEARLSIQGLNQAALGSPAPQMQQQAQQQQAQA